MINAAIERKRNIEGTVGNLINRTAYVEDGKSFSSLFNSISSPTNSRKEKPEFIQEFLRIAKGILEPERPSLESRIQEFLRNFRNLSKDQVKRECVDLLQEIQNQYGP